MSANLWYSALASPCGIALRVDDAKAEQYTLNLWRQYLGDPALNALTIIVFPDKPHEIWLAKWKRGHHAEEERLSPTEGDP